MSEQEKTPDTAQPAGIMDQKVGIIGANGALGSDLARILRHPVPAFHKDFDICDYDAARAWLEKSGVAAVINTAAFHRVPDCETEYAAAFEVNVIGVRNLARACAELDIHLCHISTDYVFDGTKKAPYVETDSPAPLSIYAISKLAGEYALEAYGKRTSIVRSCGLYGRVPTRAKGGNFVNAMIKLGTERDRVTVVNDEIVCPTYTFDLAVAIDRLLAAGGEGIFHINQNGHTTWFDFAKVIFEARGLPAKLEPISAASFQSKVQRPSYSVLSNEKFEKLTGHRMPDWENALRRHLAEI
ncbi:dTDP-4-dehydrorhamnose reductase [Sulfidibacter corallicola]|uniref:dTDP-4-dehydrorhamnose reductase n=1 Tax=Sulfidibacter corallicola TaxID=2818388 RepID=A0A8A4TWU1_SULCO|nr:dTDP-4-dehydrorhamnose reductase [Sulfidibacter corallicola]QTD53817.1 dTDP-4-dehydrorhamnose reductase [Sulfidibacter corallicola]